jgi:CRP-like cAMP-binding protein
MVSPELLRRYPFFGRLSDAELDTLAEIATRVDCAPGEVLFREGDPARACFLIVAGRVEVAVAPGGPDAQPAALATLATLGPGELLGWSAVARGEAYTASVRALSQTLLVRFGGDELVARCEADTGFGYRLMREMTLVVAARLHDARRQLGSPSPAVT